MTNRLRRLAAATAAICVLAGVVAVPGAQAGSDFDDASAAYAAGDYATALSLWGPLADNGDAAAQFNMGLMAEIGYRPTYESETLKKFIDGKFVARKA